MQVFGKTGAAITAFCRKICILDLFVNFHIFLFAPAYRFFEPFVIGTPRNFQKSTHHLNRPLFRVIVLNKLKNQLPLLEMMLIAFFNISRSISTSLRLFSNSIIFLRSSLNMAFPLPEKADSPFSRYSFRQGYNKKGSIPNSCASSYTFLRSFLNFTAFSLNDFS